MHRSPVQRNNFLKTSFGHLLQNQVGHWVKQGDSVQWRPAPEDPGQQAHFWIAKILGSDYYRTPRCTIRESTSAWQRTQWGGLMLPPILLLCQIPTTGGNHCSVRCVKKKQPKTLDVLTYLFQGRGEERRLGPAKYFFFKVHRC